jgi:hypothetical protein
MMQGKLMVALLLGGSSCWSWLLDYGPKEEEIYGGATFHSG